MEEVFDATTAFSLDPMVSKRLIPAFEALSGGNWTDLVSEDEELEQRLVSQGLESPRKRESITWMMRICFSFRVYTSLPLDNQCLWKQGCLEKDLDDSHTEMVPQFLILEIG